MRTVLRKSALAVFELGSIGLFITMIAAWAIAAGA